MASSSSPQPETVEHDAPPKLYDVFINHRGPDVKDTLATDLYNCLKERRCRAFLDYEEIEAGDSIDSTLKNAIWSSSVQIAIFSKRYAESHWCLEELALMLETEAMFIPVFYEVKPSELRFIDKGSYNEAFKKYEEQGRYLDNLDCWKKALCKASSISGYELKRNAPYHSVCLKLVSAVVQEIERRMPLDVAKHPVGLDKLVADFESKYGQVGEEKNAKIVGICGMGGAGKSTLAKELFNRKRSNYHGSCFVADLRELSAKGELVSLQTKIIKDLFKEAHCDIQSISQGTAYLRDRFKRRRDSCYLIVLDDIDDENQLSALLCMDDLGSNTLVIVTTRDTRVLTRAGITVHCSLGKMEESNARELFCWHAFRQPNPKKGYEDLAGKFVQSCQGLPLSLQVFGGLVYGSDEQYWKGELAKVQKSLPQSIKQRLKISIDALDRYEKQIFLDIACFFIGKAKSIALKIWKGLVENAEHAFQGLKDKSLVEEVYAYGGASVIRMHDHLRDIGREIADELSHPRRLWEPKLLKRLESKGFQNILAETNGRFFHSFFDQSIGSKITYFVRESNPDADRSKTLLWLELDLERGQLNGIPSWIPLQGLQYLNIVNGRLQRLLEGDLQGSRSSWIMPNLKFLKSIIRSQIKKCPRDAEVPSELKELLLEVPVLEEFPNTLGKLINLENLSITDPFKRGMLIEGRSFSESLKKLSNLRSLLLRDISLSGELDLCNGKDAANSGSSIARGMSELQTIRISCLKLASKISICRESCPCLDSLRLYSLENLAEVHLRNVTTLSSIKLISCEKLKTISGNFDLGDLKNLHIRVCAELEEVPNLSRLNSLEKISIDRCLKLQNINGIEELKGLKYLYLATGNGGVSVYNWIQRLKRLPSECAIVIGQAVDGAQSTLNANLFSGLVSPDAVTEIPPKSENGKPSEVSMKVSDSLSAIIICALVENLFDGEIKTPITGWRRCAEGERIVTMVLTGQEMIYRHHSPHLDLSLLHGVIKQKCVVTLNKGEEFKALNIFKKIIAQLCLDNSGSGV